MPTNVPKDDWPPSDQSFNRLSDAKKNILSLLWPLEWVEGAEIFKVVQQTYYDRRIRELRESGWQIETFGTKYRLTSRVKLTGNIRRYPSAKLKKLVYERDKGICCICGIPDAHMQYDHKVPQERGGFIGLDNLQLLCRTCNVEKRGVCKRCTLSTCDECPYAYPELFGNRVSVFLNEDLASKLKLEAEQKGVSETLRISEIIARYFVDQTDESNGL